MSHLKRNLDFKHKSSSKLLLMPGLAKYKLGGNLMCQEIVLVSGTHASTRNCPESIIESILDTRHVPDSESNSRKYLKKEKIIIAGDLPASSHKSIYSKMTFNYPAMDGYCNINHWMKNQWLRSNV
ncbi:hypothetical protein LguiB_031409 [Lonicera macranthoides]